MMIPFCFLVNCSIFLCLLVVQFAENTVEILDDLSDWPADVVEERSTE